MMVNNIRSPLPKSACTANSLCGDVLLSIFFYFHQACLDEHDYDSLSTTSTSPWVLSHVCQHWRTLVVSAPLLWTTIHLNMDDYIRHPSSPALALKIFLQRSGSLELDVEILQRPQLDSGQRPLDERRACIHSVLRLLRPTTARWRHLKIISSRDAFEVFAGCSFERLRSLDIDIHSCRKRNRGGDKAVVELTLRCQIFFDLPWAGIHTFTTGRNGFLCLPRMLGLQDLHIKEERHGSGNSWARAASAWEGIGLFKVPSLRTITVSEGASRDIDELLRHLHPPSLTTLVLYTWDHVPLGPPRLPVFDKLDSLVNLSLHSVRVNPIPFLTHTSSLKNLYLGPNATSPTIMKAIGLGVVPRLQTLCLHFSAWMKDRDAVISMITMRRALDCPIAHLRFARFGPYEHRAREKNNEWEWLSREALRVRKGTPTRWEVLREKVNVQFVDTYRFE